MPSAALNTLLPEICRCSQRAGSDTGQGRICSRLGIKRQEECSLSEVTLPGYHIQGSLYLQCRRQPDTISCLLRKPVCWELVMQATEKQCMLCSGPLVVLSNPSSSSYLCRSNLLHHWISLWSSSMLWQQ